MLARTVTAKYQQIETSALSGEKFALSFFNAYEMIIVFKDKKSQQYSETKSEGYKEKFAL